MTWRMAIVAMLLLGATAAWSQTSPLPGPVTPPPVPESTGQARCTTVPDQCQVCTQGTDGAKVCSTPGIACNAGALQCTPVGDRKNDSPPPASVTK
jgi:hypothetical protein